jgi:3-hydroxyisobutyrate dehydrogenase-like beta-hydroxyacid dehydrogenase
VTEQHFAVLGIGEAGSEISADLAARGQMVLGYDIAEVEPPGGVTLVDAPTKAVADASVVLALVPASESVAAARSTIPALGPNSLYADCSSGSPQLKRELAEMVAESGADFADLTLMGTVSGRGLSTPAFASGAGAQRLVEILSPLGMPVKKVSDEPGAAAERKLLRSVFVKGMTGAIVEALEAARAAGCEDWLWSNVVAELTGANEALAARLVSGTYKHTRRRAEEMAAAEQLLEAMNVEPHVTRAVRTRLQQLVSETGQYK